MATKQRPRIVLIDAHALIHRAFHAIPFLSTKDGELTNAVYGFTSTVLSVLNELGPEYIAVSFDLPEPTFRHEKYAEYKATRQKAPDELRSQFGRVRQVVEALGMPVFEVAGYEADDVLGSLAKQCSAANDLDVYIVTGDKDALQLVDDRIKIFTLSGQGIKNTVIYDPERLKEETGLTADEFVDYKALKGDPSDNIPGVPGIGDKTATTLVQRYHDLEGLYAALDEDPAKHPDIKPKVRSNLAEFKEQAFLSRDLSRIVTDIDLKFDIASCKLHDFDMTAAVTLFKELGFNSLIPRLQQAVEQELGDMAPAPEEPSKPRDMSSKDYRLVDSAEAFKRFMTELQEQEVFAFGVETERADFVAQNLVGLTFSWQRDQGFYLPLKSVKGPVLDIKVVLKELKPVFENASVSKVAHNLKYSYQALSCYGIATQGLGFDTLLGSYLLNPGARTIQLDRLATQELGYVMRLVSELLGDNKPGAYLDLSTLPADEVMPYAAERADTTWQLYEKLSQNLRDNNLDKVLEDIELPLTPVLAKMEQRGVMIASDYLADIGQEFAKELGGIEARVAKLAGKEFNLNSPSQLSEVLFEDLKLGGGVVHRGGKHKSTAAGHLERLKDAHPIIPEIIRYREYSKLKTTYIDALPKLVREDTGRVHTSYNQTVAATGRLSSSDPNLQNIPVRTELGRRIRRAFITEPGKKLLSVDYSQFELRIAAHMSDDENLKTAFTEGLDIHTATAARVAGIAPEEVQPEQRYAAKAINFSILYGATEHGLASNTGMSRDEAREYIERYFRTYPKLRDYIDAQVAKAATEGYVETLFGRRRYLPEIHASSFPLREAAKRMAINMPIQGSQADILKLAMIKLHEQLPKISSDSHMVLTVHDELVFEVPKADLEKVTSLVTDTMVHAYELSVPIAVEAKAGDNWDSMAPVAVMA